MARDMRIFSIYEGTTGIHGLTLLGREIPSHNGKALKALSKLILEDVAKAKSIPSLEKYASRLEQEIANLGKVTMHKLGIAASGKTDVFLADSTLYMELFGLNVVAWQWLKQGIVATSNLNRSGVHSDEQDFYQDKLHTMKFFFHYEVPKTKGLTERLMDEEILTIF
jgi:butyryl-CoA dehydrogenase